MTEEVVYDSELNIIAAFKNLSTQSKKWFVFLVFSLTGNLILGVLWFIDHFFKA